jgi:hypothetical protein
MKPLSVIPFVTFAALVVPNTVSAKCYKILAAKESIIYECKSSPNSFPGVIRDTLQFQFQGATVVSTEDEKCSAKVPACEDEKASEAVAGLHRAGIKKHGGNAADSQNACNDKLNSPSVCGRATARPPHTDGTIFTTQAEAEGPTRRSRYYGRYGRPPEAR